MASQTVTVRLTARVESLGNLGDVVTVPFGYARNFLLAKGLATVVSARTAEKARTHQRRSAKPHATERNAVVTIAAELDGRSVTLTVPANADGRLFARIQADDVAMALGADPLFRMDPLKQIGEHTVTLDFGHDILATVSVNLTPAPSGRSAK